MEKIGIINPHTGKPIQRQDTEAAPKIRIQSGINHKFKINPIKNIVKTQRNDLCRCGSRRKFKDCCLEQE